MISEDTVRYGISGSSGYTGYSGYSYGTSTYAPTAGHYYYSPNVPISLFRQSMKEIMSSLLEINNMYGNYELLVTLLEDIFIMVQKDASPDEITDSLHAFIDRAKEEAEVAEKRKKLYGDLFEL